MTYHSLTPRQQRVWDAAYGAAFAQLVFMGANEANLGGKMPTAEQINDVAEQVALDAANSIQPNETEPNECHT